MARLLEKMNERYERSLRNSAINLPRVSTPTDGDIFENYSNALQTKEVVEVTFDMADPEGNLKTFDENGICGVKCILVHKSGHVFETNTYPFAVKEDAKLQDEGAEITYRKRYSLGAFLGMATEEDTDGNDDEATNSEERKASPRQVEVLSKNYTGENLEKLLKMNNIEKLEDMPMTKASELIGKIMKQRKAEKHD